MGGGEGGEKGEWEGEEQVRKERGRRRRVKGRLMRRGKIRGGKGDKR